MLRIKEEVDLKELEKFGFEEKKDCYKCITSNCLPYAGMIIDKNSRALDFNSILDAIDLEMWDDVLYELIQAGMIEKV